MNIEKAIIDAVDKLAKKKIKSPKIDSEILMSQIIKKDRKFVILNPKMELQNDIFISFKELIQQRANGKPVAYLTGKKDFWKNEFSINDSALIPRPDTEIIVEEVLKISKHKNKLHILEIGVGSGCILLSILNEKKNFTGIGIDISKKCIDLSRVNSKKLGVNSRIKLFKTDVDNFNYGKYDLIISNPPYIKKLDLKYLEKDVISFEPKLALDGGLDGISEIRKIIKKSSELIKNGGKLILEIAFNQKKEVKELLRNNGFYINSVIKDLAKNDRCIISTKIK